jgi:hypothetical protein
VKTSVKLIGEESLKLLFKRAGNSHEKSLAKAVFIIANKVLNESKEIVPVDLGTLKDSGQVEKPVITATDISVEITYGGAASQYALIVHEDPNARHKDGQTYKYLEIPVNNNRDEFVNEVKRRFITYVRRGT